MPEHGEQPVSTAVENFAEELRAWRERAGCEGRPRRSHGLLGQPRVERGDDEPHSDVRACQGGRRGARDARHVHAAVCQDHQEAHPPWFAPFVHFEAMASRIHSWNSQFITGLLQTERYARAIIRAAKAGISKDVIERDVAARMERQQVLDCEEPPFCWFVIAESALRASFGGPVVMRGQMDHVLALCQRPAIRVQIWPADVADFPGATGR